MEQAVAQTRQTTPLFFDPKSHVYMTRETAIRNGLIPQSEILPDGFIGPPRAILGFEAFTARQKAFNSLWNDPGSYNKCFPAGTPVKLITGETAAIETIRHGDKVTAFDGDTFRGRGGLMPKRVVRLFEGVTDIWIKLTNGLTVTPGHHFLDTEGGFRAIDDILATDGQIILEDGSVAAVTGEYIHYSEHTADLYEQAEGYVTPTAGGLALAPVYKKGWKTYNFEVEDFHTYVAGGVRVHNTSYDFVSASDGKTKLFPEVVSRYNPDTGTFSQEVVFRPRDNAGVGGAASSSGEKAGDSSSR